MVIQVVDPIAGTLEKETITHNFRLSEDDLYISPPWIDFHCHVFHGMTSFGIEPDRIGYRQGVHLLVDAGSAGEETLNGFTDYVLPRYRTKVKAFLNISSIGLVTMQECFDMRKLDPQRTAVCVENNRNFVCGIKVRSSAVIVEEKGIEPLKRAIESAALAHCPVMIHMGENPPTNEENLALLRSGDIISHCFHGKSMPLWSPDGHPIPALKDALERGVLLDVAHGAASCDKDVAARAIANGNRNFIISTDLHGRSINGPVYSLACTMSKFLSMGMTLPEVIRAVTYKPSAVLGLDDWCGDLTKNSTLFRVRNRNQNDFPFVDSKKQPFAVEKVIEPLAVVMDGSFIWLDKEND